MIDVWVDVWMLVGGSHKTKTKSVNVAPTYSADGKHIRLFSCIYSGNIKETTECPS